MHFARKPNLPRRASWEVGEVVEEDVVPLLDTLNRLENQHVLNGSTQLFGGGLGTYGAQPWSVTAPIYGPEKVVRVQMEYVREQFAICALPAMSCVTPVPLPPPFTSTETDLSTLP